MLMKKGKLSRHIATYLRIWKKKTFFSLLSLLRIVSNQNCSSSILFGKLVNKQDGFYLEIHLEEITYFVKSQLIITIIPFIGQI